MTTLIAAVDKNWLLGGGDGKIPWHIPDEVQYFKQTTINRPVIMGRKTWDSLPEKFRPLPARLNIVVSSNPNHPSFERRPGRPFLVTSSVEQAIEEAQFVMPQMTIYVIGGAQIYDYALANNLIDQVLISHIDGEYEVKDPVYFPKDRLSDWKTIFRPTPHHGFSVQLYSHPDSHPMHGLPSAGY